MVFIARDKGLANQLTSLGSNWNILQVGVVATQSSCGCHRLIENRMDTICFGIHLLGKGLDVGVAQFFDRPPLQNISNNRMVFCQIRKYIFSGRILPSFGFFGFVHKLEFVKQDGTQLFGRSQVKSFSGLLINSIFKHCGFFSELNRQFV